MELKSKRGTDMFKTSNAHEDCLNNPLTKWTLFFTFTIFFICYLTVAPLVTMLSGNQSYERGDNVILNCVARGGPDNFYQWLVNSTDISGETSTTLMLSNVNASTGGEYSCVVSNGAGNESARTFVFIFPYFTTQPEDRGGSNGSTLTLICEAEAFPSPQFHWARMDGAAIRDGVLGVNFTMLSFSPLMFGDEGSYFCNVTSGSVTIRSNLIILRGIKNKLKKFTCILMATVWISAYCHGFFFPISSAQRKIVYMEVNFLKKVEVVFSLAFPYIT